MTGARLTHYTRSRADQGARSSSNEVADTTRANSARHWGMDRIDAFRDTVQTRPFIAVSVSAASAFGAGMVLGVLLTRR